MGLQRVGHNWATNTSTLYSCLKMVNFILHESYLNLKKFNYLWLKCLECWWVYSLRWGNSREKWAMRSGISFGWVLKFDMPRRHPNRVRHTSLEWREEMGRGYKFRSHWHMGGILSWEAGWDHLERECGERRENSGSMSGRRGEIKRKD